MKQIGAYKCQVVGLMHLHNYISYVREKKDVHSLLVLDISSTPADPVKDYEEEEEEEKVLGIQSNNNNLIDQKSTKLSNGKTLPPLIPPGGKGKLPGGVNKVDLGSFNSTLFRETTGNGPSFDSTLGLYRCRNLNLGTVIESEKNIDDFKKLIHFKYVFLVGGSQEIFDS